jgi:hypothetical protein
VSATAGVPVDLSEPAGPDPVTGERASLTEPLQDSGPDAG